MDNFGSAYAVGGFGQGFTQGMDAVNKREQLNIEKQKAAREESMYNRSMAQDELRGAFNQIGSLKDAFDNGEKVDEAQYSQSIKNLNKTLVKHNLPAINDFYDPHFGEYLENGKKVMSGELDVNHPEVIKSLNWRYHDQLNVGIGEKITKPLRGDHGMIPSDAVVEHKELHSIHPGDKGTIHPELQIVVSWKGSDGKTYTDTVKDPITYERSVHPDDNFLKPISVHDLFDQHASDTAFYKALNDPGVKAGVIGKYLAMGGKSEDLDNPVKKTQVQQYFKKDPKTGASLVGYGVIDMRGGVIKTIGDEIPVGDMPGSYAAFNKGVAAAGINAAAKVKSAGIAAGARVTAAGISKGGKGVAEIEALAQALMEGNKELKHGDAYARAEGIVKSGSFNQYLKEAKDLVKRFNGSYHGRSAGDVAKELQEIAVKARVSLGKTDPKSDTSKKEAPEGMIIGNGKDSQIKRNGKWVPYTGE